MATAKYLTLGPVTYIENGKVRHVTKAGVIIVLDEVQAAALAGSVAYVSPSTPLASVPRLQVLHYATANEFPVQGSDSYLYYADNTRDFYRWKDTGYQKVSHSEIDWDEVSDKPAVFPPASHRHSSDEIDRPVEVRTGVFQFDLPQSNAANWPNQTWTVRRAFWTMVRPLRFRVHFRNRNFLNQTNGSAVNNITMYIGKAGTDANGDLNGSFASAPVQIQTSTNLAAGNELITPWITPDVFEIEPYTRHILSIGCQMDATGDMAYGAGKQWMSYSAADAGQVAPTLTKMENQAFFSFYIEYEFADDKAPLIFIVGNSLSTGTNSFAMDNRAEFDGWFGQWAYTEGGIFASIAVSGSWIAHYGSSSTRWDHYNTLATPLKPDAVIFMAANSSDVASGTGSPTDIGIAKSNTVAAITKARAVFPDSRLIVTNIPPRVGFTAGDLENARLEVNEWMMTCPAGAEQCLDVDSLLTDWADPARLRDVYDADGTHWSPRGHSVVARLIPVRRH
ncbi:SGNH/GDSL hydrolase family protein [Mycolicibacterium phlei]|uniref:SGNH/GDSL hydrolase family protein n=1 Tax=Mycolicibacterium phlei TaxID=1771 RepID=UPI0002FB6EFD|nr:SGNH/GDSL hydrolase family protein [Mycolicibacterium phlei]